MMRQQIAVIFKNRQDAAMRHLKQARMEFEACQKALADAQQALKDYKAFRLKREEELYREFMAQPARTRDLELVKGKVGNLLAGDAQYEAHITTCEHQLERAEQVLIESRQRFVKSSDKRDNWDRALKEIRTAEDLAQEVKQEDDLILTGTLQPELA